MLRICANVVSSQFLPNSLVLLWFVLNASLVLICLKISQWCLDEEEEESPAPLKKKQSGIAAKTTAVPKKVVAAEESDDDDEENEDEDEEVSEEEDDSDDEEATVPKPTLAKGELLFAGLAPISKHWM